MPAYILEIDVVGRAPDSSGPENLEFVEITVKTGTDMSDYKLYIYAADGSVSEGPISLGTLQSSAAGNDTYLINGDSGLGDITYNEAVALVDGSGDVVQFVSFNGNTVTGNEGPASGLGSTDIGTHGFNESLQSDNGGASYYTQSAPNPGTAPCYASGTMIETINGPRPVETLRPGDWVTTLDHGTQIVRWVRSSDQPLEKVDIDAKPVLIAAGALGQNLPTHDLIVSPQHRILVGGRGQLEDQFGAESFVPAKSLTALRGIRHMNGKAKITWIHFACDQHEVVIANGCFSESLLLGGMVVSAMTASVRRTLENIYGTPPSPDAPLNGPASRQCLTVGKARRHLAKTATTRKMHTAEAAMT